MDTEGPRHYLQMDIYWKVPSVFYMSLAPLTMARVYSLEATAVRMSAVFYVVGYYMVGSRFTRSGKLSMA